MTSSDIVSSIMTSDECLRYFLTMPSRLFEGGTEVAAVSGHREAGIVLSPFVVVGVAPAEEDVVANFGFVA